jgi:hypothetical protein
VARCATRLMLIRSISSCADRRGQDQRRGEPKASGFGDLGFKGEGRGGEGERATCFWVRRSRQRSLSAATSSWTRFTRATSFAGFACNPPPQIPSAARRKER